MQYRLHKLRRFLLARFKPEGFLGLYLIIAAVVLVAGTWLFIAIAEDVGTHDRITILDARLSGWLYAHQTRAITALMLFISWAHSSIWIDFVTLVIIVSWWFRKLRYWAIALALSVYGGSLLNFVLKYFFARPRPRFEHPIMVLTSYSFPSGHTLMATVFYGTLCAFSLSRSQSGLTRTLAVAVSILMISVVGFSRIYLGAHYLSDVIGAFAEGLAWLAICLMGVNAVRLGE